MSQEPRLSPRLDPAPGPAREPRFADYVASARPYRRRAAVAVALGTALAAVIAFLWPPSYRAVASILPPSEEQTGFSITSVLRSLSVPGVRVPSRSGPTDVALSVLNSRRAAEALVQRFDLRRVYGNKRMQAAVQILQKRSGFGVDPSGAVMISVEDRSPERAAQLANAYIDELDRFNREVRMTKGRRMRLFVEKRLADTGAKLAEAEQVLRRYQSRNRAVALTPEQSSTVESGARLFASQTALQVQLGVARQYATEQSEEVRRLRAQLDQVNREIGSLPALGLDLARMLREVKIQEQVFALLSAQYEEAQIDEARDVPTLEVLDRAEPPDRPVWPRKGRLIAFGFGISLFGALAWIAWNVRRTAIAR